MARSVRTLLVPAFVSVTVLVGAFSPTATGATWPTPINLSASVADTHDAAVAVDSAGRAHVVWSEDGQVYHRYSIPGGGWSAPARAASGHSPDLAAGPGGRVHMALAHRFAESDEVYVLTWGEEGWGLPANVSASGGVSSAPRIACSPGGELAVVWVEEVAGAGLIHIARPVEGAVWSAGPVPNAQGARPAVAFVAGSPVVAWQDVYDLGFPLEVYASRWTGSGWTLPVAVSASPLTNSCFPALAGGPGGAWLGWEEVGEVYVSHLVDTSWAAPEKRSAEGPAHAPALAFDAAGGGHLVWTGGDAVQHRGFAPLTGIWQAAEAVAWGQPGAMGVRVAAGGASHVVWLAEAAPGNRDVYYSGPAGGQATPTATRTATPSRTPTRTATPSRTPTRTATPTPASSPGPTATPVAFDRGVFLAAVLVGER